MAAVGRALPAAGTERLSLKEAQAPSLGGGRLWPGRGLPSRQTRPSACGQRCLQPVDHFSSGWLCFSDPLAASPHALRQSLDPRHSGCASDECGLPFLGGGFGRSHAGCSFLQPITSWWRALVDHSPLSPRKGGLRSRCLGASPKAVSVLVPGAATLWMMEAADVLLHSSAV